MKKGYIKKFWLIHTAKYYFLMFFIFFLVSLSDNFLIPSNGLFLLPVDLVGFGMAYGGFFELTLFMFIVSNIFVGIFVLGIFLTFFMFLGGDYPSTKTSDRKVYWFFITNSNKQSVSWILIRIFYLYSIPILALNTKVMIIFN